MIIACILINYYCERVPLGMQASNWTLHKLSPLSFCLVSFLLEIDQPNSTEDVLSSPAAAKAWLDLKLIANTVEFANCSPPGPGGGGGTRLIFGYRWTTESLKPWCCLGQKYPNLRILFRTTRSISITLFGIRLVLKPLIANCIKANSRKSHCFFFPHEIINPVCLGQTGTKLYITLFRTDWREIVYSCLRQTDAKLNTPVRQIIYPFLGQRGQRPYPVQQHIPVYQAI